MNIYSLLKAFMQLTASIVYQVHCSLSTTICNSLDDKEYHISQSLMGQAKLMLFFKPERIKKGMSPRIEETSLYNLNEY